MTKRGHVTWAFGLAGLLFGPTFAQVVRADQDSSLPGLGSRVRVTPSASRSGPFAGTLTGIDEKSLAVQVKGRPEAVVLERHEIRRLERSVRPSRKKKGALLGLGIGFGAGVAGTFLLCEAYGTECPVVAMDPPDDPAGGGERAALAYAALSAKRLRSVGGRM